MKKYFFAVCIAATFAFLATPTIALTPANGIWGYVYEWNGTPTNTTCIVTTQIDYGNHTKTFRVNVDNWNGAGSYKITPGPNDPPFPPNTQQQVVANNGGRVGYVTFNYGGGFQQAPILH